MRLKLLTKISLILCFNILTFYNLSYAGEKKIYTESTLSNSPTYSADQSITGTRENAITRAVRNASPAIVGINVTEVIQYQVRDPFEAMFDDPFFRRFFGNQSRGPRTQEYQVHGLGSGFIISPDGYILTNHHVAGNASKIIVTMTDGKKYDAEIIGSDMTSDVALLKINGKNFPYLKLANSDEVILGEWVIAFGNPFGLFDKNAKPTITVGVVSNTGINFVQDNRVYKGMIQTDAAISSGNSGGPLINSMGEVIGINSVIFSTAQNQAGAGSIGIGWSIPINRVKKIVDLLITDKTINRNFVIGMEAREIDDMMAKRFKIEKEGVYIMMVERNSPAERAGFEAGDVITEIDGQKISKADDYLIAFMDGVVGQKLNVTVVRDGARKNIVFELSQRKI